MNVDRRYKVTFNLNQRDILHYTSRLDKFYTRKSKHFFLKSTIVHHLHVSDVCTREMDLYCNFYSICQPIPHCSGATSSFRKNLVITFAERDPTNAQAMVPSQNAGSNRIVLSFLTMHIPLVRDLLSIKTDELLTRATPRPPLSLMRKRHNVNTTNWKLNLYTIKMYFLN